MENREWRMENGGAFIFSQAAIIRQTTGDLQWPDNASASS
jgi:hypothetical protein